MQRTLTIDKLAALFYKSSKKHLIILDHASIHKGKEIDQLVAQCHVRIAYLPTYSPNFNPEPSSSTA
ncbi:transposase [Acinetobacter sp.]|uniref:transposase n=1 Tax=Acinetobacter sp. TaxID=472 RepID=UPI00388F3BF0